MAVRLDEQELSNLDKQTLIKMYLGLQDSMEKLSQSIDILTEEVIHLRQHRFGRSSEKGPVSYTHLTLPTNREV